MPSNSSTATVAILRVKLFPWPITEHHGTFLLIVMGRQGLCDGRSALITHLFTVVWVPIISACLFCYHSPSCVYYKHSLQTEYQAICHVRNFSVQYGTLSVTVLPPMKIRHLLHQGHSLNV